MTLEMIVWVWLAVNVGGFVICAWLTRNAMKDVGAARRMKIANGRRVVAAAAVRRHLIQTVELGLFTVAGLFVQFGVRGEAPRSWVPLLLLVTAALIVVNAILDVYTERRLLGFGNRQRR